MKVIFLSFIPLILSWLIFPVNQTNDSKTQEIMHTVQDDGPYVLYKNEQVFIKYILNDHGRKLVRSDSMPLSQKESVNLVVSTDEPGKTFTVQLKKKMDVEKAEYKKVNKQFVISDIEGNFGAFRKLLQGGGVMDANYNWTFGDGHLVLVGDFFDRGSMVTEVLWLIYSLEEKASHAGGYVHFILGNHEIMNMSDDIRYVQVKYKENATLLGEKYVDLYGENSEMGRWLRTKNIIEKVGNVLYTHGGISAQINNLNKSIEAINELARPFYPDSYHKFENKKQEVIFGANGPFWYRGYYDSTNKTASQQIENTIEKFKISHIVTGHTVVADTISSFFGGKLFNTDVHHAAGHSEALLIESDKFYRVNASGVRILLKE